MNKWDGVGNKRRKGKGLVDLVLKLLSKCMCGYEGDNDTTYNGNGTPNSSVLAFADNNTIHNINGTPNSLVLAFADIDTIHDINGTSNSVVPAFADNDTIHNINGTLHNINGTPNSSVLAFADNLISVYKPTSQVELPSSVTQRLYT